MTKTTNVWLVMEFNVNSGTSLPVSAYNNEQNARACAADFVGRPGIYISIYSLELQDERI